VSGNTNRYSLFGGFNSTASSNDSIEGLGAFVKQYHQRLLAAADVLTKAKLLRSYHRSKPNDTEDYLRTFINDFQKDPKFSESTKIYREKLKAYRQAKNQAALDALSPTHQPRKEHLKLSPQQRAWQELTSTLKRCINNKATHDLAWHPHHQDNYYLAKLYIQWSLYEKDYAKIHTNNFKKTLAYEVAEGRRQTVIEDHVEAQQNLTKPGMQPTPSPARQQQKLEQEKNKELTTINALVPQLIIFADEVLRFAQKPADQEVEHILGNAIVETRRYENQITGNPALFHINTGPSHSRATLDEIDGMQEMKRYCEIFVTERNAIEEAAELNVTTLNDTTHFAA